MTGTGPTYTRPALAPKLSVITPSFNQGRYIERAIRSVLDQGYPNLEYVIVDGGSTDETLAIIRRYEDRLAWWVSEPDDGQADAINKGIAGAGGEIVAYLCADDYYLPGALETAVEALERSGSSWIAGAAGDVAAGDPPVELGVWQPEHPTASEGPLRGRHWWLLAPWHVPQPSAFWRRELFERFGPFQRVRNGFDAEFMMRLAIGGELPELLREQVLAVRFGHPGQKSREQRNMRSSLRRFGEDLAPRLTAAERRRFQWLKRPVWAWHAVRDVAIDPALRLGGRLLDRLPAHLRPRIRGRDRRPSVAELRPPH
jgi:glycosyltransferase involved in cell wall biosynthesis